MQLNLLEEPGLFAAPPKSSRCSREPTECDDTSIARTPSEVSPCPAVGLDQYTRQRTRDDTSQPSADTEQAHDHASLCQRPLGFQGSRDSGPARTVPTGKDTVQDCEDVEKRSVNSEAPEEENGKNSAKGADVHGGSDVCMVAKIAKSQQAEDGAAVGETDSDSARYRGHADRAGERGHVDSRQEVAQALYGVGKDEDPERRAAEEADFHSLGPGAGVLDG